MKRKVRNLSLSVLLALVLIVGGWQGWQAVNAVGGEPDPGTVVGVMSVTFADGTAPMSTTTYYGGTGTGSTASTMTGYDTRYWHAADLFVTADVNGTNTITVTPQWSADNSNWVDGAYTFEGWVVTTALSSSDVSYQLALSADGTSYMQVPMRGLYFRLKTEVISTALQITPTIYAVLRNDGGR